MAKDYAKRSAKTAQPSLKKGKKRLLIAFIALFFLIAFFGMHLYRTHFSSEDPLLRYANKFIHPKQSSISSPIKTVKTPTAVAEEDASVKFDFYSELPKMQVTTEEKSHLEKETKTMHYLTPKMTEPTSGYILQIGVFEDEVRANQFRLSLLLSGYDSDVKKLGETEGNTYRVQRGPFSNQIEAKKLQQKLKNKGIASEILKVS